MAIFKRKDTKNQENWYISYYFEGKKEKECIGPNSGYWGQIFIINK